MVDGSKIPQTLSYRLGAAIFLLALAVRFLVYFIHGRSLVFLKYPSAATLLNEGRLDQIQAADYSPLYLGLHRLAQLLGVFDFDFLRISQMTLGAFTCVLIGMLGARLLGRTGGVVAAGLAVLQRDLILYDQVFEPETVVLFCVILAFLFARSRRFENLPWRWLGSGAMTGLAIATRPSSWLVVPVILLAWAPLWTGDKRRSFIISSILFLLIAASAQLTTTLFTRPLNPHQVMSPWQVFYTGNNPNATGLWRPDFLVKDLERQAELDTPDHAHADFRNIALAHGAPRSAPDKYWAGLSFRFIADHPGRYLQLLGQKALALGQHHDPHDINTVYRLQDRTQRWPLIGTWMVVALGLAGFVLCRGRLYLVFWMTVSQMLVCLLFFVSVRYRLALVPWMCISSAYPLCNFARTLEGLVRHGSARDRKSTLIWQAPFVSVLLLTLFWLPLAPGAHAIQDTERLRRAARSFREADRLKTDHRLVQAAQKLRHSAQAAPWHLNLLPIPQVPFPLSKWAKSGISDARDQVSQGGSPHDWLSLGFWLDFAGAKKEAISAYEQVSKAAFWPGDLPAVHVAMIRKGLAHLSVGDVAPGRRAFELASELKPGSAQALIGLAMCSEEDEAQTYLERAERATPLLEIYYFHGRMLLDCGRPGEAVQPLSKLTHRLPQYARGRMLFAIALYRTGRLVAAAEQALGAQRQFPDLFDAQYTPLDMLTRAAEQNPHNRSAWRYLARIASHYGDLNLALTAWSHLKQHRQLTPDDQIHIGMLLLDHERPGDAVPYFEAALHTGNPSAQAGQNGLDLARRRIRGR